MKRCDNRCCNFFTWIIFIWKNLCFYNRQMMMNAPIILLKEGTEAKFGKQQIISNISACNVIADSVRTTLGPRGMDKLVIDSKGKTTISNDGATILKLLDVVFPAAQVMVDIAKSQDAEVGDGTTSVVILSAELLKRSKPFIEDGVSPQLIIRSYSKACEENHLLSD
ncbi:unnamed protein product [Onchocerca flexuosa]|uniref:T-complex protein 1 subunit eta n=1 Tax=Onchocerca flexuosa TaxID=387005 RepID=A0A183HDJ3_9BILA|nr:unnamed protein product [Onchocerca flexuosa]